MDSIEKTVKLTAWSGHVFFLKTTALPQGRIHRSYLGNCRTSTVQGALLIFPAFMRLFQVFVEPLDVFRDVSHVPLLADALDKTSF